MPYRPHAVQNKHSFVYSLIPAKAFHSVWRNGLWYKIGKCGIKHYSKIHKVITDMYNNIKSCIFMNGNKSYFVRQGEQVSPLLFSLFVNDLEMFLSEKNCEYLHLEEEIDNYLRNKLLTYLLLLLMYADDTVIFANDEGGIQKALDKVATYCKTWNLKVKTSKTKVTIFGRSKYKSGQNAFYYDGEKIEIVSNFKYLVLLFNYKGKFHQCIKNLFHQGKRAMF